MGSLLRRVYGVEPAEIETSHPGNRVTLVQVAVAVTQQYALWLQRRHGQVSAPRWGINTDAPAGPRVHVVAGTGHKQSAGTDIDAAVDGPRLHMVDTSQDQVGRGLVLREVTGGLVKTGPSRKRRKT